MKNVLTIPHWAGKKKINNENLPSAVQAWKGLQQTETMIEVLVHNIFSSI